MSAEDVREFYRRQGEARERERIIALLEATKCTSWNDEITDCYCGSWDEAIALIKGDNK